MEVAVTQYFQDIFTSVSSNSLQQVIQHVERVVSPEMNNILLKYFYDDKVKTALFQMHPTKALGPDNMNPLFFQHYWHIVRSDVSRAIIDCLNLGTVLSSISLSHITLIPKKKKPNYMPQF